MRRNVPYSCKGFTLIEVVAVLVLLGTLTVVALPRLWTRDPRVEADILRSHVRFAQWRAMSEAPPVCWGVVFDNGAWTLTRLENGVATTPAQLPGEPGARHDMPAGVTLVASQTPLYFNDLGCPVNPLNIAQPLAVDSTVTLTWGAQNATVTILRLTGLVR